MRISLLLAFSLSSFTFAAESAGPKKPNILIIVADDLGYADTGFNGSKTAITPKLDSFVKSGIKLTDFRACPMCSPTRGGTPHRTLASPLWHDAGRHSTMVNIRTPGIRKHSPRTPCQGRIRTAWHHRQVASWPYQQKPTPTTPRLHPLRRSLQRSH